MKKYIELDGSRITTEGDEWKTHSDPDVWEPVPINMLGKKLWGIFTDVRRPVPFAGKTAFDVFYSPGFRIIIDTDGLSGDEINEKLAEAAEKKFRAGFEAYMAEFYENIDWERTMECADCPYEPGDDGGQDDFTEIPGKYRCLYEGELLQSGDEYEMDNGRFVPVLCLPEAGARQLNGIRYRRPITEPQYRPFREGDVIELGDQFNFNETWLYFSPEAHGEVISPIHVAYSRKLVK